ncbi:MAG TPA: amino acid adenylation domain-containing protein [Thermoanaerobaculia bacterium]|nr:amino acid adenylation domain-containing protein [Thermoanaerobaculia bacterium]
MLEEVEAPSRSLSPLTDLLSRRAAESGGRVGYLFIADSGEETGRLTWAELDRRAQAIAAALAPSVSPGERALLLFPPGLDFIAAFFGCLYAGVVAVPAYPPRPGREQRLLAILRDAAPRVVLTTSELLPGLTRLPELGTLAWLATDGLPAAPWAGASPEPDAPAFLQYTSGSTALPKGVMVTHANLAHNSAMIQAAFRQDEESVVVGWLPLYHDMGLIGNVLQPLWSGGRCVLMSPVSFLQRPRRWLEAVSRYRATTSGGPNFAYELCVNKVGPEDREGLDLSSWRVAFNGAEPVRAETLERFAAAFGPCGFRRAAFYPCYGLAEGTLFVTGGRLGEGFRERSLDAQALERHEAVPSSDGRRLVSSGHPWVGQRVAIADPETGAELPPGRVGEVWVQGPSVARGYWGREEETARTFGAFLDSGDGPFLRTGDLGFRQDGELFVTGRHKDLIILRGRNHYPQDLERTAEQSHPALRPGCGAAFPVDLDGEERLVIVHEVERRRGLDVAEVAAAVRRAVAGEHEVQVHQVVLLRAGTIPKTSSGKIQRHACRAGFLAGTLTAVGASALEQGRGAPAPSLPGREELAALAPPERREAVVRWLGGRVSSLVGGRPPEPEEPLTALGLDSLAAAQLKAEIETAFGVTVPLAGLLEGCGTAALADLALAGGEKEEDLPGIEAAGLDGDQPLSAGQKALWFLYRLAPASVAYNIAGAARLRSDVGAGTDELRRAFQTLVDRHPMLRVTFAEGPDGPVQRVAPAVEVAFLEEDAAGWSEEELRRRLHEEAFRPFDLERGPVFRVALFRRGEERLLAVAVHHIAADLGSLAVLVRELGVLLRDGGAALPSLDLTPFDYARWQERFLAGPEGERLWEHWRQRLAGVAPLDLPTDRPRPAVPSFRGGARGERLDPQLAAAVRELARSQGCTLFMTLLAAWQTLLARYSGQDDFAVGAPTAGRSSERLAGLVGYFVQPVALRADLSGDPPVTEALARARRTALDAFAHQEFPFARLAERLLPERDTGRSPLFQTLLVLQKAPTADLAALAGFALGEGGARLSTGGLELESVALESPAAQFDLTLTAAELDGDLGIALQWSADLFDDAAGGRMLGHFANLLRGMAAAPDRQVRDLELLGESERRQIEAWSRAGGDVMVDDLCLHQLFEAQAARTPEATALLWRGERLSYQDLNRRANRLAHRLRALGVGPETRVGVLLDRSPDLVAALLGVLKAGGAYVALDPAYPRERLASTLADAEVAVLLTRGDLDEGLPTAGAQRLDPYTVSTESPEDPAPFAGPDNLAYVLYTSGSTGRPKGVAIAHRGPVARMLWAREAFSAAELAGVLAATSICFDLSVFELFVPLSWGGAVVLADNALALPGLAAAAAVTLVNTVPSAMAELAEGEMPPGPLTVNLAGEALPVRLAERIHRHPQVRRLLNLYGPSEDTTYSTFVEVPRGVERMTVGRPLAGTRAQVLDAGLRPVPVGVPGELCLAGAGLARGYLGRPDLTAERFVPDASGAPGERLYRTGDVARWLPPNVADGEIELLGRLDHQVKVRGFRIELGEVEAALYRHPGLREAAVVAHGEGGDRRLVAYVVPRQEPPPAAEELRRFLAERLPAHMVPAAFVPLAALPRTGNGKLDRRALPDPGKMVQEGELVAPRSVLEEVLAGIWAEVLQTGPIGVHDSFFSVGGHSLNASQVLSKVRASFGVELPVRSLFEAPTVAGLAVTVVKELARQAGADGLDALLEVEEA